jgi:L,D-transpeptidase ErfK/SrfK
MIWALSRGKARGSHWFRLNSAAILLVSALAAQPAVAGEYSLAPGQKVVGEIRQYVVQPGEGLNDIARRFDVGYTALAAANPGVDQFHPGVGRRLIIPSLYILPDAPRQGIVMNLAQYRLYYFPPSGDRVFTYPIGIGVIGWKTPLGATRVVRKQVNPTWYPPPSIRAQHAAEGDDLPAVVPPGPDNPLGIYALYLGWPKFLIHDTNKPDGVGRNVSHGCIHLYPADIAQLYPMVGTGTTVRAVIQPAAAGWRGDELLVSVFPSQLQVEEIDTDHPVTHQPATGVDRLVQTEAGSLGDVVDWGAVRRAADQRNGVAVAVAGRSAVARNEAPTSGLYGMEAATRAYDDTGPPQRAYVPGYYDQEMPRSTYDEAGPSPRYYGQDLTPPSQPYPYYGNGALQSPYQRPAYQPYDPSREAASYPSVGSGPIPLTGGLYDPYAPRRSP